MQTTALFGIFKKTVSKSDANSDNFVLKVLESITNEYTYILNISDIFDTYIKSLDELCGYSTASYVVLEGNKLITKFLLKESVSKKYIEDVKTRMIASMKLINPISIDRRQGEDTADGLPINDLNIAEVLSFVNVPLVVDGELVGAFALSSTKSSVFGPDVVEATYRVFKYVTKMVTNYRKLVNYEKGKLQVMVDNMYDGVLLIDKTFDISVINPACYKLMGIVEGSGINVFDVFDYFSSVIALEEKVAKVFAGGKVETATELRIGDKYYEITIIPVSAESGVLGAALLVHDQTKEIELRKLRQDFTAMMVHELRSPLTVIKGTSDLLLTQYKNLQQDQIDIFMKQIKESSIALLSIVNELLDASKIEAGKIELFRKPADINKLINDEFNYYFNLAKDKHINFTFDLDLSIQKFAFDEQKIKQVLNNLLSNSIKFTDTGGSITIVSKNYETYINISVIDTGKGVPDELKEKLFQKFVQARESDKSNEPGTGLGLAICKGIIDAHNGRIWIEDNTPSGAKFIFTLPIS